VLVCFCLYINLVLLLTMQNDSNQNYKFNQQNLTTVSCAFTFTSANAKTQMFQQITLYSFTHAITGFDNVTKHIKHRTVEDKHLAQLT